MTICIDYGDYTLFDIEYWCCENNKGKWYSEIRCCVCVKGISMFLKDNIGKEGFDLDGFIKDSEQIQEIRGWLWEMHNNRCVDLDECQERHYHMFLPELYSIIDTYCNEYGFYKNID